ncbi:MAG: NADH-quinone oxidoreductase subunit M [Rickettsiales bacterium]|nr:NADH-quinone oxidoreductase subunit M [Rickettsiales bacterium]|tara:strand:- start:255 stop:1736 length:1482 start_codon:yes stop_codon:yes gene_type:complete
MAWLDSHLLTSILLCPVIGLALTALIPASRTGAIKLSAAIVSGISCALSILLWQRFDPSTSRLQFTERMEWLPDLGITYIVGIDGLSLPMVLLTGIVFFTGVLTMWELENRVKEYFAFTMALVAGVFGVFISQDLFFLFLFYELAVLPMYLLIAIWGSTRREYAAMKLTLFLLAGSALLFPALIGLSHYSGLNTFDLTLLSDANTDWGGMGIIIFLFLYLGFGVLAGIFPFHTWSPVGHVAAPTAVSMLHAGVLMKLGSYGVLRVGMQVMPEEMVRWAPLIAALAVCNILYGAFVALGQTDLKYVIGYSSVSHMGVVMLGLATMSAAGISGAVFQMFAHGIMTALFFSSIGHIYDHTHTREISRLGGLFTTMPRASTVFIIAGMAGIGVPCLASFWAELLVFIAAVKKWPLAGALAIFGLVVSALFVLRVVQRSFFGPERDDWKDMPDMGNFMATPRVILAAVLLLFGFAPFLMLDQLAASVDALVQVLEASP